MLFTAAVASKSGDIYVGGLSNDPAINLVSDSKFPVLLKMSEKGTIIWQFTFDHNPNARVSMIRIFSKNSFQDTIIAIFETFHSCFLAEHRSSDGKYIS